MKAEVVGLARDENGYKDRRKLRELLPTLRQPHFFGRVVPPTNRPCPNDWWDSLAHELWARSGLARELLPTLLQQFFQLDSPQLSLGAGTGLNRHVQHELLGLEDHRLECPLSLGDVVELRKDFVDR